MVGLEFIEFMFNLRHLPPIFDKFSLTQLHVGHNRRTIIHI